MGSGRCGEQSREGAAKDSTMSMIVRAALVLLLSASAAAKADENAIRQALQAKFPKMPIESIVRTLNIDKSWTSRLHTRAMARITKRLRSAV